MRAACLSLRVRGPGLVEQLSPHCTPWGCVPTGQHPLRAGRWLGEELELVRSHRLASGEAGTNTFSQESRCPRSLSGRWAKTC